MSRRDPTIIALGGGGFSMEPENPLLDVYVLEASGADDPRIAFLPTASGDREGYVADFHAAFAALGARTEHVLLPWAAEEGRAPEDGRALCPEDAGKVAARFGAQDVIYVGGGNTRRMLAVWRAYGIDRVLRDLGTEPGQSSWIRKTALRRRHPCNTVLDVGRTIAGARGRDRGCPPSVRLVRARQPSVSSRARLG